VARQLAESMRKHLNNATMVVENVTGAGGTIAATKVARSAPDGYTVLVWHIGMAATPALYRKLPYKPLEAFEYVGVINDVPMTLIGKPQLPANTYRGTALAMNDLMGGTVDVMCDQTTNTTQQIEAGRVKAFAVTTAKPLGDHPSLKHYPSLQEMGLKDFNLTIWHGLYAPAGTPAPVVQKLHAALRAALADPEFQRKQKALGAIVVNPGNARATPAGHKAFVADQIAKIKTVVDAAGQYAD